MCRRFFLVSNRQPRTNRGSTCECSGMSWIRALGCTMMMVNERLVPSRLKSLIGDNPCEEEVSGGAPNSENVDVCK